MVAEWPGGWATGRRGSGEIRRASSSSPRLSCAHAHNLLTSSLSRLDGGIGGDRVPRRPPARSVSSPSPEDVAQPINPVRQGGRTHPPKTPPPHPAPAPPPP